MWIPADVQPKEEYFTPHICPPVFSSSTLIHVALIQILDLEAGSFPFIPNRDIEFLVISFGTTYLQLKSDFSW